MMKYLFLLLPFCLIVSCKQTEKLTTTANIRINHYKQSAIGESVTLVYLVQENNNIGTDQWNFLYSEIKGFDFEWGFVYDLVIEKQQVENPPQDASSIRYILKEVVSKKAVDSDVTFNIQLKSSKKDIMNVVRYANLEYTLLEEKIIDCQNKCLEMNESLENESEITGIFKHKNGKIELQELLN